jgi:hypothetical protein
MNHTDLATCLSGRFAWHSVFCERLGVPLSSCLTSWGALPCIPQCCMPVFDASEQHWERMVPYMALLVVLVVGWS